MPAKVVKEIVEKRADPMLTHFIEDRFDRKYEPIVAKQLEFSLN